MIGRLFSIKESSRPFLCDKPVSAARDCTKIHQKRQIGTAPLNVQNVPQIVITDDAMDESVKQTLERMSIQVFQPLQ